MARRFFVAALVIACLPCTPASAAPAAWVTPVDGAVARAFVAPHGPYAPGHRGVDFHASADAPVRAAGAGKVTFSGTVAGALHVVVAHSGGLRTSYSYVKAVKVRRGDTVRAGEVVAIAGAAGENHDATVLHFGLRDGDTYIDPMLLFAPIDLAEVVHLAPTAEPFGYTVAEERRGLLDGLSDAAGSLLGAQHAVARETLALVDASADAFAAGLAAFEPVINDLTLKVLERARRLYEGLPPSNLGDLAIFAMEVTFAFAGQMRSCTWNAPAADGTGGSGHHVMVVAGLASHTSADGRTLDLPVDRLGYESGDVAYFSYSARGGAYTAADTLQPIMRSAQLLADQLKARQRAAPGREVDLIAHSLGGMVVLAFLRLVYDPMDPDYPPLSKVVTMAAPLEGAPVATFLDFAREVPGLPEGRDSIADLSEDSELISRLRAAPTPPTIELTTVGSVMDVVVPADRATTSGARHTIVDASEYTFWQAHMDIVRNGEALRAARAGLEGEARPCQGLRTTARAELIPPLITLAESGVTPAAWGASFDGL